MKLNVGVLNKKAEINRSAFFKNLFDSTYLACFKSDLNTMRMRWGLGQYIFHSAAS